MPANETTDGWPFPSTQEVPLTLKLLEAARSSRRWVESSKPMQLVRLDLANSLSPKSKHAIEAMALCGLFYETEAQLMNDLLGSLRTPADAVALFRKINVRLAFYRDTEEGVSIVLPQHYQSALDHGIVELLDAVPKLPKDILSITTRFLVSLRRYSTLDHAPSIDSLLRKIMLIELVPDSITNGSVRGFLWNESNQRKRTKNMPAEANATKSWIASSYVKEGAKLHIDGTGSIITITHFKIPSAGDIESYAWEVASADTGFKGRIFRYGFSESLEQAAEDAYKGFYQAITQVAFENACAYAVGKEIILVGNELTSEEFIKGAGKGKSYYFMVQMPLVDDRDPALFCLNWPSLNKVKRTFKIIKVNGKQVTIDGGTVIDTDAHHCYVKNPELHVGTELLCTKCGQLGYPGTSGGKFIQGKGYECGPCIDHSVEFGELSDAQFD